MAAAIYNLKDGAVLEDGDDIPTINGSRHSASAKHDFIARDDEPSREDRLVFVQHGNMPLWAQVDPSLYWRSAEEHERANARLFKEVEFELPAALTQAQKEELVTRYTRKLSVVDKPRGRLPFTAGIHEAADKGACVVHMMFSERVNDGHARTPELWFRRAATGINKTAADGGAKKIQLRDGWFANAGKLWADMTNEAVAAAEKEARRGGRSASRRDAAEEPKEPESPAPETPPLAIETDPRLADAQAEYEELREDRAREDAIDALQPVEAAPAPAPEPPPAAPAPPPAPPRAPTPAPQATPAAPAANLASKQAIPRPLRVPKPAVIGAGVLALLVVAVAIGWPSSPTPARNPSPAMAATPALPLPASGQGMVHAPWAANALVDPFVVVAPAAGAGHPDRHYFVTAHDWNTGSPVLSIFVRAGESGRTVLPKGTYRITVSQGTQWYGPQQLFGPQTVTTVIPQPVGGGTLNLAGI